MPGYIHVQVDEVAEISIWIQPMNRKERKVFKMTEKLPSRFFRDCEE